jgi:hypothetical protein
MLKLNYLSWLQVLKVTSDNALEDKYKLLMKEYYQKLKTPLESFNRRAQESCFVKIHFFDGKFDYQFGKDIMDFNKGLGEIESFCNKLYPPLSGQSPMNVHAVADCIDSFTEDILEKVNKIFDRNIVVKCMELLAKEKGLACYLFFSRCLGLRVKILAIETLYLAFQQESVKVITVTHISTNAVLLIKKNGVDRFSRLHRKFLAQNLKILRIQIQIST